MYIQPTELKQKRTAIRKMFPVKDGWKWSVTGMENQTGVVVSLMQYPRSYSFFANARIDHTKPYQDCLDLGLGEAEAKVISKACMVMLDGSASAVNDQRKYHVQLLIGKWDTPCQKATG